MALLKTLGCADDLSKVVDSKKIRRGVGKARNRRYVMRKGPLLVHSLTKEEMVDGGSLCKSFRNIPGVECAHVDRLNLLQLAPGGHFGRFVIYTESAMKRLSKLFGTFKGGAPLKKGYTLPRSSMTNTDIARIINSTEVQGALNARKEVPRPKPCKMKKNPLRNKSVLGRLCPAANALKKVAASKHDKANAKMQAQLKRKADKKAASKKAHKKEAKAFYKNLVAAYAPKPVEAAEEEAEE
jgi:large subunit ribosomal protein L4e